MHRRGRNAGRVRATSARVLADRVGGGDTLKLVPEAGAGRYRAPASEIGEGSIEPVDEVAAASPIRDSPAPWV